MKIDLKIYQGTEYYFITQIIFWLAATILLIVYGNGGSFVLLNGYNIDSVNHQIYWLTGLSGGLVILPLFVLAYARKRPVETITVILAVFAAWYTCILIKYTFYQEWKAPAIALKGSPVHLMASSLQPELDFPSAHATIVTALATCLAWMNRRSRSLLIVIALFSLFLVYLRIYAGWSYLSDVVAGSVLGAIMAILGIRYWKKRIEAWYARRDNYWQNMIVVFLRTAAICTLIANVKYFTR